MRLYYFVPHELEPCCCVAGFRACRSNAHHVEWHPRHEDFNVAGIRERILTHSLSQRQAKSLVTPGVSSCHLCVKRRVVTALELGQF